MYDSNAILMEDDELMFLFLNNDKNKNFLKQELNNICEKYYEDIHKYCEARLDKSYADDITNEVFELFCKKWQKLKNNNYRSWLYETANNLVKNFYKKHKRKIIKETYINESIEETLSYEQDFELIDENQLEKYKNEILETLSEKDRELYILNYIKKLPHIQIREKLSINEEALNKRIYRLKQKIIIKIREKLKNM